MSLFRYREGEARKFENESDVPAGEGWQDTPVTPMSELVREWDEELRATVWRKPGHVAPPPAAPEAAQTDIEIEALRSEAVSLGIEVDGRWGVKRLQTEIDKALSE